MKFLFKKFSHLVRYFIILGIVGFAGYTMRWQDDAFLCLAGPSIYLAHEFKSIVSGFITTLPNTETVDQYFFLMPVMVFYFGVIGILLKNLWNERGFVRNISLVAFVFFLGYIHYMTYKNLSAFSTFHG